jgi:hypothetical protein
MTALCTVGQDLGESKISSILWAIQTTPEKGPLGTNPDHVIRLIYFHFLAFVAFSFHQWWLDLCVS